MTDPLVPINPQTLRQAMAQREGLLRGEGWTVYYLSHAIADISDIGSGSCYGILWGALRGNQKRVRMSLLMALERVLKKPWQTFLLDRRSGTDRRGFSA